MERQKKVISFCRSGRKDAVLVKWLAVNMECSCGDAYFGCPVVLVDYQGDECLGMLDQMSQG